MPDLDTAFDKLQREIDDAIAPENMSAHDALELLGRVQDYCRTMREGIEADLDG